MPCEVPRIAEVYMMKKMRRRVGKILNSIEITSLGGATVPLRLLMLWMSDG